MYKNVKLKFTINLVSEIDVDDIGNLKELYRLKFNFLNLDDRFEVVGPGEKYSHECSNGFKIESDWDVKNGELTTEKLILPFNSFKDCTYVMDFPNDEQRYIFTKNLYSSLMEWSNYWWGFQYDSGNKVHIDGDTWTVRCEFMYSGSLRYMNGYAENFY